MSTATGQAIAPWEVNRWKPVSLLDMLRVYADEYVKLGRMLEELRLMVPDGMTRQVMGETRLFDTDKEILHVTLTRIRDHCEKIGLRAVVNIINHSFGMFEWDEIEVWRDASSLVKHVTALFEAELQGAVFMCVPPDKLRYWTDGFANVGEDLQAVLVAVDGSFFNARHDLEEAGRCLTFDRFTACVYHLMRAAEYGLFSVAASVGVEKSRLKGWEDILRGINEKLKAEESSNPKPEDWQERRKKYGDLCSWFTTIKNGWRNPASHIPRIYDENSAKGMFSAVGTLFQHLKQQGISQTEMPTTAILPPEDDAQKPGPTLP